jgi:hypothetical protein
VSPLEKIKKCLWRRRWRRRLESSLNHSTRVIASHQHVYRRSSSGMEVGRRVQKIFCRIITQTTRSNIAQIFFSPFSSNRSGVELKNNWFIARLFSRSVWQTVFTSRSGQQKNYTAKNPSKERWEVDGKWFSPHDVDWGMDRKKKKKSHRCPPNINGVFLISLFVCVCVGNLRKSHNGADSGDCGKGWLNMISRLYNHLVGGGSLS